MESFRKYEGSAAVDYNEQADLSLVDGGAPYIHPAALCESKQVGQKTRIWAFAHVLPGAKIGADCNICDHVFIENDVILGDRVTVKCGVQLWDGLRVEDNVFIGPNATFANDKFPRSKQYPAKFAETVLEQGCSIGAGAVILPGLTIGRGAMVGAGSVVTKSVPAHAVVMGNPAKITGYVESRGVAKPARTSEPVEAGLYPSKVSGVTLHTLPLVKDLRGDLSVGEFERSVPFAPRRYFLVFGVPNSRVRGEHAHKTCAQFLIAVKGRVHVVVDDGGQREEFILDKPNVGLFVPPMVWATQYKYSEDAVLLVFASEFYSADDYIRDYAIFSQMISGEAHMAASRGRGEQ